MQVIVCLSVGRSVGLSVGRFVCKSVNLYVSVCQREREKEEEGIRMCV